jgi:putative protease
MLPVSELNRLRRELVEELDRLRSLPHRWTLNDSKGVYTTAASATRPGPDSSVAPEMILVVRSLAQLSAALAVGNVTTVYCEFENPKNYRDAVRLFRDYQAQLSADDTAHTSIWVAPPRIFKPGEEWILKQVLSCAADGYLVRNYEHLRAFAGERLRGDFSLNVANPLTAEYFISHYKLERVTASYDLNIAQLDALLQNAPPTWFDLTLHQHMPMFHMEHCVFCAFLSEGKDYRDCGRPCDRHDVRIRDRVGADLPLKADAGCRNTVYNNRAQTGAEFFTRLTAAGARHFRIEFVDESPEDVTRTIGSYRRLFDGQTSGADLWRELRLINQLGVTRGQMETAPQLIQRKS